MFKLCTLNLDACEIFRIEINQSVNGRSAAPHGIQQKICRDFLSVFAPSGALVAPQRDLKEIIVLASTDFFKGTEFHSWLQKECLEVKQNNRADTHSVEECLRYSIVVWLEPHHYYRCGKALLKGPFLEPEVQQAVRIFYCTSCGDLFLRVTPEIVRLFRLETWELDEPPTGRKWVYCLPKLGRGQLVEKHSRLPPDCGFATYGEMRAYWKNCYGYDLPLAESEHYYDVWFNGINNSFLYPDYCVMSSEPVSIQFRDEYTMTRLASEEFCNVFASTEHRICGEKAYMVAADPKLIKLSVLPTGSSSRRRKIASNVDLYQPREKETFPVDIPHVNGVNVKDEKSETYGKQNQVSAAPATKFGKIRKSFPLPIEKKRMSAAASTTAQNSQKLLFEMPGVTSKSTPSRKRRINVE
ncbi:hypothetical protein RB195_007877 [Necator americanus]|uniref:DUF4708 domain-containing protein n=1 Tax=Necator americanus TaxID=51031 RepID=A0ABR1BZC1_NECAM